MTDDIKKEFSEVVNSVGPVSVVVFLFLLFISRTELLNFFVGLIMVIFGITLFILGINLGFLPFGEAIGSELPMRGSLSFLLIMSFIIGFITTIAEPDVRILASQVDQVSGGAIPQFLLILSISFGIGVFISLAMLRMVYGIGFPYLFIAGYAIIIILSLFTPESFVAVAFDGGGVTTGPVTVPILLSLGIGVSSVLGGKSALSDGFGLMGIASMGPIISVMLLGVLYA